MRLPTVIILKALLRHVLLLAMLSCAGSAWAQDGRQGAANAAYDLALGQIESRQYSQALGSFLRVQ